jgi:nicotinate phosphoribosyltransferase
MQVLDRLYRDPLSLLTDLYQLTMAFGYWQSGLAGREAVFHLFFRRPPFGSGYTVAAGLHPAVEYLRGFRFAPDDLEYLAGLRGADGAPLFPPAFLDHLGALRLTIDLDAVAEGTPVFPHEPLLRVRGPLLQCQLLETPLLNILNFQTLIATKAARVCDAAAGQPVLEFGARRAQGIDGAVSAARAAYVGGCAATSNLLAGKLYGIPVRGTHAHSWVMCWGDEREAFARYADALPGNCVFLVDTYDTLAGVRHAIEVGRALRARGHDLLGVRLDSGDLAHLSLEARRLLDEAGFAGASIVASNELDEHVITSLKQQGAAITVWGVGTRLATAFDQPALGGVYKLAAIRDRGGSWRHTIKLSEQPIKINNPGVQQVRRYLAGGAPVGDVIYDEELGPGSGDGMVDLEDPTRRRELEAYDGYRDLLEPILRGGEQVWHAPALDQVRERAALELGALSPRTRRLLNPQQYPVGLEDRLHRLKLRLVAEARDSEEIP